MAPAAVPAWVAASHPIQQGTQCTAGGILLPPRRQALQRLILESVEQRAGALFQLRPGVGNLLQQTLCFSARPVQCAVVILQGEQGLVRHDVGDSPAQFLAATGHGLDIAKADRVEALGTERFEFCQRGLQGCSAPVPAGLRSSCVGPRGLIRAARYRRHFNPPVAGAALVVGIRVHRLLCTKGRGEHHRRWHAGLY